MLDGIAKNTALSDKEVLKNVSYTLDGLAGKKISVLDVPPTDAAVEQMNGVLSARIDELGAVLEKLNTGKVAVRRGDEAISLKDAVNTLGRDQIKADIKGARAADPLEKAADKPAQVAEQIALASADRKKRMAMLPPSDPEFQRLASEAKFLDDQMVTYKANLVDPNDKPVQYLQNHLRLRAVDELDQLQRMRIFGTSEQKSGTIRDLVDKAVGASERETGRVNAVERIGKAESKVADWTGAPAKISDQVNEVVGMLKPRVDFIKEGYLDLFRKYDPDVKPPIEDYFKHIMVGNGAAGYFKDISPAAKFNDILNDFKTELIVKGVPEQEANMVAKMMASEAKKRGYQFTAAELKGRFAQFMPRKYRKTIREVNMDDLGFKFEDNALNVVNAMQRDYDRTSLLVKMNDYVKEHYGMPEETVLSMPEAIRNQYRKMELTVPWINPEKQPFLKTYVPADVYEIMKGLEGSYRNFTSDEGFKGFLSIAHRWTNYWKSITLFPLPAFHVRNAVDNAVRADLGGLSLANKYGQDVYRAATELYAKNAHPVSWFQRKAQGIGEAAGGDKLAWMQQQLKEVFPDKEFDAKSLKKILHVNEIVSPGHFRDIDLSSRVIPAAPYGQNAVAKAFNSLRPGHEKDNWFIKTGMNIAQPIEDIPRIAMFMKEMVKNGKRGMDFDQAVAASKQWTFKYLFDPTGKNLSPFEANVLKLAMPFYQFSRNNIPLWAEELIKEPGRIGKLYRAYNGLVSDFSDDLEMENAPEWLRKNFGIPYRHITLPDGSKSAALWSAAGWMSISDLVDFANIWNPYNEDGSEFAKFMIGRANPIFKEPLEQMFNYDTFLGRKIREGQTKDVLGIDVPDWFAHILKNLRLVGELDRLNPYGAFTGVGNYLGNFKGERPNRTETDQALRVLRTLTGLADYPVDARQVVRGEMIGLKKDLVQSRQNMSRAVREGDTSNIERMQERQSEISKEMMQAAKRLNEINRKAALSRAGGER